MRKNLSEVPVQITVGRVPAALADEFVTNDEALSIKGKAVLMMSAAGLERLLPHLNVNPAIAELILRAARLIEAQKAAAPPTPHLIISRVAVEQAVVDIDVDHEAATDVARSVVRAQDAVIAHRKAAPDSQGNGSGDGK
jgi:hypothetical protein